MASKNYIFYKIFKEDLDEVYVGSTANFYSRKKSHKHDCNNEKRKTHNFKIYQTIRENGGWDEFKMIQIGTRENITKREAEQIEEEYRLELKGNLNMRRAFLSPEVNKEYHKEYNKERYQVNKDLILEQKKEYRQTNKEKICEKNKEYRQTNKEKISEQKKEKIICEICNIEITRSSKAKHMKSQRHINNN
jgi:hypothetical protein